MSRNPIIPKLAIAFLCFFSACRRDLHPDNTTAARGEITSMNLQTSSVWGTPVDADANYDYSGRESELLSAGWKKAFEDQFNNNDPAAGVVTKLSQWNIWQGGSFNNELQYYQADNLQVEGGNLVISAQKESIRGNTYPVDQTPKDFNFTSGRIESKSLFSAGSTTPRVRMVARIKLPRGNGMWPAFWSYGDPWPTQGEIDILEARGQDPYQFQTNYFYGREANVNLVKDGEGFYAADENLQEGYHVYEMVWTRRTLEFYLDGKLIKTNTGGYVSNLFGKKEKVTLNLAVGGNFFVNLDPATIQTGTSGDGVEYGKMFVDWVKVFTAR